MKTLFIALMIVLASPAVTVHGQSGAELFQKALEAEEGDANLREAIRLYEQIEKRFRNDRALVVRALLRMARALDVLGDARARQVWQRLAQEYSGHKEAAEAEKRLAELQGNEKAAPTTARIPAADFTARHVWTPEANLGAMRISFDGRWMAVGRGPGGAEILARNMASGALTSIAVCADPPAISRDGRLFAYNFFGQDGRPSCDVDDPATSGALRLTVNEPGGATRAIKRTPRPEVRYYSPFAFSPDNRSVYVIIVNQDWTDQLARVLIENGTVTVLKSLRWRGADAPTLSPDGRYIAYAPLAGNPSSNNDRTVSRNRHIYLLAADGTSERLIVGGESINTNPVWSRDGSMVFFLSDRGGDGMHLWAIDVRNGRAVSAEPVLVRRLTGQTRFIGGTEDGALYFVNETPPRSGIYIADVDPATGVISGAKLFTDGLGANLVSPSWSRDGQLIAFRRPTDANRSQISIRSVATGADLPSPPAPSASQFPVSWVDGRTYLDSCFNAQTCGESPGIFHVDVTTQRFRTQIPVNNGPQRLTLYNAVSPDGQTLYVVVRTADNTARSNRIVQFDAQTGRMRGSFDVPGLSAINGIAMAPDGRTLAVTGAPAEPTTAVARNPANPENRRFEQHLVTIEVDGNHRARLLQAYLAMNDSWARTLAWSRNSQHIFFGQSGEFSTPAFGVNHVMRIPAAGGTPQTTGLTSRGVVSLDLDPTGKRVVYDANERFAPEAWVLEPAKKR